MLLVKMPAGWWRFQPHVHTELPVLMFDSGTVSFVFIAGVMVASLPHLRWFHQLWKLLQKRLCRRCNFLSNLSKHAFYSSHSHDAGCSFWFALVWIDLRAAGLLVGPSFCALCWLGGHGRSHNPAVALRRSSLELQMSEVVLTWCVKGVKQLEVWLYRILFWKLWSVCRRVSMM